VSPLVFEDSAGAEQILAKLADVPSITRAKVYDTNGELFVSFATSDGPAATSPIVRERSSEFMDNYLHVYEPIIFKDEYYGTIYLQASTQLLDTKIRDYLRYMALLMVGLTIVSVFLAIRLQRIISKPILNLASVAQQIAEEKNYSIRVQKKGNDETGLLYDGFNNMLDQVQSREIERDRAEDALRESEEKFRTLTSNIPGAVYRCADDPDWTVDFISDVIEEISGYKASDFIQNRVRSYASIVLADDLKMVKETVHKAISKREPYLIEYRIVRSDGHIRWVYEKGQGIFSDDGNLLWLDGAIFDITERKLAEEELAKHRNHLEDLVETRTIEITEANKQLQQEVTDRKKAEEVTATRLRYEEGLAACSRTLLTGTETKEGLSEALGYLLKAANASRVYFFENFEDEVEGLCMRLKHENCAEGTKCRSDSARPQHTPYKQGFDRWRKLLSKGEPIKGKVETFPSAEREILESQNILSILILPITVDEEWCGYIGFDDVKKKREWSDEDIRSLRTASEMIGVYIETKRFEEALRVSEERFRSLVENANDIIYSLTPKGEITYISPKATDITGYDVSYLLGKNIFTLLHPDDIKSSIEWFQSGLQKKERQSSLEFRLMHKDGSVRWFVTQSSVIHEEEGDIMEIIGVAHDFTEVKKILNDLEKANQHLRETQAQLVQSAKMASLGKLVAGIAHEINTPIGAVNSMQDTLFRALEKLKNTIETQYPKEEKKVSKLKANLKVIDESKKVINSGTERVINVVKRLRSFARLDEAELKTVDIHEGLEDTLTLIHHDIKHNIQVKKTYGNLPPIACYPGRLNQVFLNILVNAKQAIKGKGNIDITTYTKQKKVFIEIKDNGVGIDKEHLKKVFDPGFTTKGVGVGTGLGLSICYQIMQDHQGEILVESEVNKGTTFTVVLPMALDDKIN
ncbi:MAG: PAS domain S-box protein, partial [Candidatus Aminicenantes bacterium]|nr:PAS domain S-box protein [Candidatus Aminicenantes bacterium]